MKSNLKNTEFTMVCPDYRAANDWKILNFLRETKTFPLSPNLGAEK